jgi:hypothetical protein
VLGALLGFERIPAEHRAAVLSVATRKFDFTDYSFDDIVASTERRALLAVQRAGGRVTDTEVTIPLQTATPPPLETSGYGRPVGVYSSDAPAWTWRGQWRLKEGNIWSDKFVAHEATGSGSEAEFRFTGTGLALMGDLVHDGGRAEVFIDGQKSDLVADAFLPEDATHDDDLWRIRGLRDGEHVLKLVMLDSADPHSTGRRLTILRAVVYRTP